MISIVMPWRPQPSRIRAFEHTKNYYISLLERRGEPFELVLADNPGPFNLSAARNRGVAAAEHELILMVDADSIAPEDTILEAINMAGDNRTHYCFDGFVYLTPEQSEAAYNGNPPTLNGGAPHESSVMVLTKHAYWTAGGMDERFQGYGGEDNAFRAATDTMNGPSHWHHGIGYSLHHEVERKTSDNNFALVARYRQAWQKRPAMHALIFEDNRISVTP